MTVRANMTVQDRYRLRHPLGTGGFGQVWQATDLTLEREVAVKFAASIADDPRAVERFTAEARKLARLRHRGIVTVHDAGVLTDDGRPVPYLVMELVDGSTWQQGSPAGPAESVARTGAGLADALAHLHAAGIVHRDVKPANVMIRADGEAVLLDLGTARDLSRLTTVTAGVSPGTLAYMAPEQLAGAPATAASDVYALGLVLVEKLTGVRGPAAQLPAADRAAVPPHLRELLDRMTALDPAGRPAAAECRELLGRSVPSRQSAGAGPAPQGTWHGNEWVRFGVPAAVFLLVTASSDFWPTDLEYRSPAWIFLAWLVRFLIAGLLLLTASLTPRSGGVLRGVGYGFAALGLTGVVVALILGPGPTDAHNLPLYNTAALLGVAAYCYREATTRRAVDG
ncbi:serine/threonine-protein kinase [Streptomyces sp. RFCAC02]|uniref:serine/threonine-protein kinase n=1 Tax=Streptomyces sp. RFCAC02 TaxID=2499143 RepID=UPI00101FBC69|nr:serine/threonine-protein kinase [Streptomyces sp. RFCAC02]